MHLRPPRWLASVGLALLACSALSLDDSVLTLKFSDFHRQPVGPRGLEFSDTLRAANGRLVRIVGYMVASEQPQAGRLLLTARPVRLSEHADGEADDLPPATVLVLLDPEQSGQVVPHTEGLIALSGRLAVGRLEDSDGRVSWIRLQLPPDATRRAFARPLGTSPTPTHTH